jgi:hypothetical protein
VGLTILSHPALANPYDDCILQHMGTAQNQTAVYAIERACIDKTSVPIAPDDNFAGGLNANVGEFNTGDIGGPEHGLVVTMKNTTNYNVTEVIITIINKTTHELTRLSRCCIQRTITSRHATFRIRETSSYANHQTGSNPAFFRPYK